MYRRSSFKLLFVIGTAMVIAIIVMLVLFFSPSHQAKNAVDKFYSLEQEWDFSSSWNMLHPQMKERFTRGHYIQDRSHVFMNHFGVDTFSYSLSRAKKINNWRKMEESEPLTVYKVTVTKKYKGKYGNFRMIQDVFAAKEDNKWKILWDYKGQ
ncbi:hypothetical protein LGQ02_18975 [Bacillus shivajii]|uniref:hypothetical protein n=1 Tax=Bacillus shivajii TaxID=1983719 RepID=UPI001CFAC0BD|nr:hypothetical protein [Bacillus shivajii]UCZ52839.1 hypothetical protein LGQ02_18975 [Bacillus shivajii]